MNNQHKKCEECGELLKPSKFARLKRGSEPAAAADNNLVCRNDPACKKAEKEVTKYINLPKHIAEYKNQQKN